MDQYQEKISHDMAKALLEDKYDARYEYSLVTNSQGTYVSAWDEHGNSVLFGDDDFTLNEEEVLLEEDVVESGSSTFRRKISFFGIAVTVCVSIFLLACVVVVLLLMGVIRNGI